jgi:hypothetical protein
MNKSALKWFAIGWFSAVVVRLGIDAAAILYRDLTADAEAYSVEAAGPSDPLNLYPRKDSDPLNKGMDNSAERGETE